MENCLENLMVSARTRQVNEARDRAPGIRGARENGVLLGT